MSTWASASAACRWARTSGPWATSSPWSSAPPFIFGATEPGDYDAFMRLHHATASSPSSTPTPRSTTSPWPAAPAPSRWASRSSPTTPRTCGPVPKSLIINTDTKDSIDTSLEARGHQDQGHQYRHPRGFLLRLRGRDHPQEATCSIEIDGSRVDCVELVRTKEPTRSRITRHHPGRPGFRRVRGRRKDHRSRTSSRWPARPCRPTSKAVFERKFHSFLNCIEGVMHTGQRDMIRIRVSNAAFDAGFRAEALGEVLYAKIKSEFDTVVDKCQVKIYTDPEKVKELRARGQPRLRPARRAPEEPDRRDRGRVLHLHPVPGLLPQSHVCIVTPERLGLCGAVSWLDAKATNELDPHGPCQIVTKTRCIDERTGRYEDVNEAVQQYSHGALEQVTLYSIMEDPDDLLRLLRVHLRHRAPVQRRGHRQPRARGHDPHGHDLLRAGLHDRRRRADPGLHGPRQALHRLQEVPEGRGRSGPHRLAAQGAEGADRGQAQRIRQGAVRHRQLLPT